MTIEFINRITKILNKSNVEYLITGGSAKLIRNERKSTMDLDLLVKTNNKNISLIKNAFMKFGIKNTKAIDELKENKIVRIKLFPFSIDLMPKLDGLKTDDVFSKKEYCSFNENIVPLISKNDLIINYKNIPK